MLSFSSLLLHVEKLDFLLQFFGRFHLILVHLPIGLLALGVSLEVLTRQGQYAYLRPTISFLLFWGMISAVASCIAGFLLAQWGDYDEKTLHWHQWMGISVALVTGVAYLLKQHSQGPKGTKLRFLQIPLTLIILVLLTFTGHLGGTLTHGDGYLSQPLMAAFSDLTTQSTHPKITDINEALVYQDLVAPVFEQKCWQCHNSTKQKGGLRMDTPEQLLKGGENGPLLTAGHPDNSLIMKRLLLPEIHDDHMPPKGKAQLNDSEIALLHWWIQHGASFDKKVVQLPTNARVKTMLTTLTKVEVNKKEADKLQKINVSEAANSDIEKLTRQNVIVIPIASGSPFIMINMVNAPKFCNEQMAALTLLKEQAIWLKMNHTSITDESLQEIGKFPHLMRLNLANTAITDAGLNHLRHLTQLEYLNLYGTKITDNGLASLAKLKQLKALYLWQTSVTSRGLEVLRKQLPKTHIDMGGYVMQKFPLDTLPYKMSHTK